MIFFPSARSAAKTDNSSKRLVAKVVTSLLITASLSAVASKAIAQQASQDVSMLLTLNQQGQVAQWHSSHGSHASHASHYSSRW